MEEPKKGGVKKQYDYANRSKQETHTFIFSSSGNAILLKSERKTMEAYLFSKEFHLQA
jgi:hypothetical protein